MDSDCEVQRGGFLEAMLSEFKDANLYAIGDMCRVNGVGVNVNQGGYAYIHPFAAIYDKEKYLTLPPFIHHGAPAIQNMIAAKRNTLRAFDIKAYIEHKFYGTRGRVMSPAHLAIAKRSPEPAPVERRFMEGFVNVVYTGKRSGSFGLAGRKSGIRYTVWGQQQSLVNDQGTLGVDPQDVPFILSLNRGADFAIREITSRPIEPIEQLVPSEIVPVKIPQVATAEPFMSFVTRVCKRPIQLLRCLESISCQTDQDFENVLLVDSVGVGVNKANEFFYEHRYRVRGQWVYMLDDDDMMIDNDFIAAIKQTVDDYNPDIIMVKASHMGMILPDALVWGKKPVGSHIGTPAFVVRNDIWREHIKEFGGHGYAGDFTFGLELFKHDYKIYWLDRVVCSVPFQHVGLTE
jgi:hypothetical protein